MKQIIKSFAVLLAMCAAAAIPARAASPGQTVNIETQQQQRYVVVNGTNVRLRFEPNLNSSYLRYDNGNPRYAPKGTYLTYLGQKGDFYYVQYAGYKVYISKQYSYLTGGNTAAATPKAGKYYVVVNGVNVRLRTGPSTNYPYFTWNDGSPCYLPKGSYLDYVGQAGDFYKCTYQGHTVYISKKYSYITK